MGHGACYFKAWDYRGKSLPWPREHGSLNKQGYPSWEGLRQRPPFLPRGLTGTRVEGPVHGKLSVGATIWSRNVGAHRGLF